MKLTPLQEKRLTTIVKKILVEYEGPANKSLRPEDEAEVQSGPKPTTVISRKPVKLGLKTINFLPTGGVGIQDAKSTITFDDNEARKLADLIIKLVGKPLPK